MALLMVSCASRLSALLCRSTKYMSCSIPILPPTEPIDSCNPLTLESALHGLCTWSCFLRKTTRYCVSCNLPGLTSPARATNEAERAPERQLHRHRSLGMQASRSCSCCITPAHLHGAPHALVQPAVLLSLCTLYPCLRKEAYPKVLVGWARTIPLLHVEGININASLSPCVPAGMLGV